MAPKVKPAAPEMAACECGPNGHCPLDCLGRKKPDAVFRPNHYARLWPEPITVINAWALGFNLGNAVKYIARAGHKGDLKEDLEKAKRYIEVELECIRRREAIEKGAPKATLIETL